MSNSFPAVSPAGHPLTLPQCVRAAAEDAPDLEAIVDGDERITFAQLAEQVLDVARGLIARNVAPGERVALWAPNSARWIVAAMAVHAAGAVLVPINTRFRGEEARYAIATSRASAVLLEDDFLGTGYLAMLGERESGQHADGEAPIAALPGVHTVVRLDRAAASGGVPAGVLEWDELVAGGQQVAPSVVDDRIAAIRPDDPADILFTSGTTGVPKGAVASHRSDVLVNLGWASVTGLRRGDRYLLANPFFHSFGYRAGVIACILTRATMLPLAVFDTAECRALIVRERATVFPGAPAVFMSLLQDRDVGPAEFASVRLAVTGAAVVPVPMLEGMRDKLQIAEVVTGYGLTESCGTSTVCPPDADLERLSRSSGRAIPGTEVRVVAEPGRLAAPGEHGEVQVRGINVMLGYFEDPEATARAVEPDGWLHTGDVGTLDEEGYLYIVDRIKDVFFVGGFNVYPAEVEQGMRGHRAVGDVAVVGVADSRLGEVGLAFVELAPDAADRDRGELERELLDWCADEMANFKVPRQVRIVDELPRTRTGKVQKHLLRAAVDGGQPPA